MTKDRSVTAWFCKLQVSPTSKVPVSTKHGYLVLDFPVTCFCKLQVLQVLKIKLCSAKETWRGWLQHVAARMQSRNKTVKPLILGLYLQFKGPLHVKLSIFAETTRTHPQQKKLLGILLDPMSRGFLLSPSQVENCWLSKWNSMRLAQIHQFRPKVS